jgi:hypothetical protein
VNRSRRSLAALGGVLLALAGCSSNKLKIEVNSTIETNEGRPFYAVVRQVEQATYVTDGYDIVAAKVFVNPPDPSVLRSEVVYPGKTLELTVPKSETAPIAVYFLFSRPGERWKMSRVQPLPSSLTIELDKNQIKGD